VRRRATNVTLPPGVVSAGGAATFGVVGIALAGPALNALARGGNGAGSLLSGAIVALVVALLFAGRLVQELRSWSAH
jgi:hypothetical protein